MRQRKEQKKGKQMIAGGWREWLQRHFPQVATSPMPEGGRHARLWDWFEHLEPGVRPQPHGEYWPRGGAKSSTAELAATRAGERLNRRFVLYVSGTQGQANKHVQAIATNFETLGYERAVGKYGNSKGWKVDLLRVANGFNVLALGLDAAARGVKLDNVRPDLIILDDVDDRHDKPETVQKKIATITESILPAGSADCAILFVQNLIHAGSIATQLAKGTADFLLDREPAEIEPAVRGLRIERVEMPDGLYRYRIVEGEASWEGQSLATCEKQLNDWGRAAFMREAQHDVEDVEDGLWQRERDINPFRYTQAQFQRLQILRTGEAIDPSIGSDGDEVGMIVGSTAYVNGTVHAFIWRDRSQNSTPKVWTQDAVDLYYETKADFLAYEGNYFKQIVKDLFSTVPDAPPTTPVFVYRGKLIRAEPVQKLFEDGRVHIVGSLPELEKQLCTYKEGDPSPGRMDALVILVTKLMLKNGGSAFQSNLNH